MHILCPACELISKIDDSKIVKPPLERQSKVWRCTKKVLQMASFLF